MFYFSHNLNLHNWSDLTDVITLLLQLAGHPYEEGCAGCGAEVALEEPDEEAPEVA
jgi:hypothetical protein